LKNHFGTTLLLLGFPYFQSWLLKKAYEIVDLHSEFWAALFMLPNPAHEKHAGYLLEPAFHNNQPST